jgi:hypothetical protein
LTPAGLNLQITLIGAPNAAESLREIVGVTTVEVIATGVYRLGVEHPAVAESITAWVVARGWGVRELRSAEGPLEQTFLALTAGAAA